MIRFIFAAVIAAALVSPADAHSQQRESRDSKQESDAEREARRARAGAGLRVGHWDVRGLRNVTGASTSGIPAIEGWHQRGLDRHVSLETSIAVWGRRETVTQSGGFIGGSSRQSVATYVVPFLSSVQFHPFTGPEQRFEPFLRAGAGVTLGIENREGDGSIFGGSGTGTVVGLGAQGGIGLTWRFSRAMGLITTGSYRWTHFTQELSGLREYKGLMADVGLFYRFQYR